MPLISAEVMRQLEQAQAELAETLVAAGPPLPAEMTIPEIAEPPVVAAGCAKADHLALDHHFTRTLRRLWAFAGGGWRFRDVGSTEEYGLAQVAFAADTVLACWDASNHLTMLRCLKSF